MKFISTDGEVLANRWALQHYFALTYTSSFFHEATGINLRELNDQGKTGCEKCF